MIREQNLLRQTKGRCPFVLYQEGQKVWLEATNLKTTHLTTKLVPRRYGPFQITKVILSVVYQLSIPQHWHIHNMFHMSLLSPYVETQTHGPNFEEQPPDLIEEQPEWEVQEILDSQRFRCKKLLQYQVQWKGYSQVHNSWELANNVFAPNLVKEYYKNKGVSAVKTITPIEPSRINTMATMPSATSSTPSYILRHCHPVSAKPAPGLHIAQCLRYL